MDERHRRPMTKEEILNLRRDASAGKLANLKNKLGESRPIALDTDCDEPFAQELFGDAAGSGQVDIATWLIEVRFPNTRVTDLMQLCAIEGGTSVYEVFHKNFPETLERDLKDDREFGGRSAYWGNALGYCIDRKCKSMVGLLLSKGADPNKAHWSLPSRTRGERSIVYNQKPEEIYDDEIYAMLKDFGFVETQTMTLDAIKEAKAGNLGRLKEIIGDRPRQSSKDDYDNMFAQHIYGIALYDRQADMLSWVLDERFPNLRPSYLVYDHETAFNGGLAVYEAFNRKFPETIDYDLDRKGNPLGIILSRVEDGKGGSSKDDKTFMNWLLSRGADPNEACYLILPYRKYPGKIVNSGTLALLKRYGFLDIREKWNNENQTIALQEPYRTRYIMNAARREAKAQNFTLLKAILNTKPLDPKVDYSNEFVCEIFVIVAEAKDVKMARWLLEDRFPTMTGRYYEQIMALNAGAGIYEIYLRKFPHLLENDLTHNGTPLSYAVRRKDSQLVKFLLKKGSDPNNVRQWECCKDREDFGDTEIHDSLKRYGMVEFPPKSKKLNEADSSDESELEKSNETECPRKPKTGRCVLM